MSRGIQVQYRKVAKYKYLVTVSTAYQTPIKGFVAEAKDNAGEVMARLEEDGRMYVFRGYAWDGPSGPTIDTPDWMDPSLVHDVFYQFLRSGELPKKLRKKIDKFMFKMLLREGMSRFRARYSYIFVRLFGGPAARRRK